MKNKKTFLLGILSSMMLTSCGGDKSTEDKKVESTVNQEETSEPIVKSCKLKSYSFQLGDRSRIMNFSYTDGTLSSVEMSEKGSEEKQNINYVHDENGNLSSFELEGSKGIYTFNENGQLTEIKGEGSLNTRTFEYDENGNMIKQVTLFGGKPYTTHIYSYEGDTPSKVDLMMKGELYESYSIDFDDKNNPMKNKGVFVNGNEMMFGLGVANYNHNILSVTSTNKKGEQETRNYSYEYNESGYPTVQKMKKGEQETEINFEYDCE